MLVEFGEKVKRAREEKGMTQQTLSEHLYVTRQAVSRWECGARYPDLLNAKKLSDVLGVSLDELLSGEEMKKCVEKNPIVESQAMGRVQSALYGFAGAAYLLMSIFSIRFIIPELSGADAPSMGHSISYMIGYVVTALLLFCGLILSVRGKLTPRKTGVIISVFFGKDVLSNIFVCVLMSDIRGTVLPIVINLIFISVIIGYYFQPGRIPSAAVYVIAVWYVIREGIMYAQMGQFEAESTFLISTIRLTAVVGYMGLIVYQTYVLEKKWRLTVRGQID